MKNTVFTGAATAIVTQHLYDTLTGIQWGKTEDVYGWTQLL